ncbi:MAG: peptidoglycan editing factor PgeF [Armatimonadota bacterium]|nr:MAG: peptidoglycan editing factor PgeF [Armatimonadota bacterium]
MHRTAVADIPVYQFELIAAAEEVIHGVTTRHGGVSAPPFDSLNLSLHVGDSPERVIENRRRLCLALDLDFRKYTVPQEIGGDAIHVVSDRDAGAGRVTLEDWIPGTDALVVAEPGITIAITVADCAPIVLYDAENHIGALVHAGGSGTSAAIAAKAVRFLAAQCGSRPAALLAGIGPAIGPCCYEVTEEIARDVSAGFPYREPVVQQRNGRWYANLEEANRQQLVESGLDEDRVERCGLCTACRTDEFYSDRQEGRPTGRFVAVLCLR